MQVGRNISMVLVAVFLTSSSFFLLTFTSLTPYLGMGMMGVAYSILVSALWPIAALMVTVSMQSSIKKKISFHQVPDFQLGTAYGLMTALQNLGVALVTMAAGKVVDR